MPGDLRQGPPGALADGDAAGRSAGPVLRQPTFCAELSCDASGAVLTVRGAVTSGQPEVSLTLFLDEVHGRLVALGCREVQVDFRPLEHLSPDALNAFIHWTDALRSLPPERRYQLRFVCAPGSRWQRTSLLVLQCYAADLVEIA